MRLRDQNGGTVCTNRISCPATNTWKVAIFTGQYHFVIDVYTELSSPEWLYGGILDLNPESQNAHNHYVCGHGKRAGNDWEQYSQITAPAIVDKAAPATVLRANARCGVGLSYYGIQMLNGSRVYRLHELQ